MQSVVTHAKKPSGRISDDLVSRVPARKIPVGWRLRSSATVPPHRHARGGSPCEHSRNDILHFPLKEERRTADTVEIFPNLDFPRFPPRNRRLGRRSNYGKYSQIRLAGTPPTTGDLCYNGGTIVIAAGCFDERVTKCDISRCWPPLWRNGKSVSPQTQ